MPPASQPDISKDVPILIVGGGPAGLSASIFLAELGIESLLVERRSTTTRIPKAHIINQRTLEIFRQFGLAGTVFANGSPHENMARVAWYTSWAGPTELHGREIARLDSWGGGDDLEAYEAASPCLPTNFPQIHLEPVLFEQALARSPGRVLRDHELVGLRQDESSVVASIQPAGGEPCEVRAEYLIAADGGRSVGPALGIEMVGERELVRMVNAYIRADLSQVNPDPSVAIHWFVNPDRGGSIGSGVLVKMGGRGWGADADEWVLSLATSPEDPTEFDAAYTVARAREAIGMPDLDVEVRRISEWSIESIVAERFRDGRVFLAGDAAHKHPPTGGLGLNTAVADVHNLSWKLAAVLRSEAGAELLASYEPERRHVAARNAAQSLQSFFDHGQIDAAIGLEPEQAPADGWQAIARIFASDEAGADRRERLDEAVAAKRREFRALNLELGYTYEQGALIDDDAPAPVPADPVCDYLPTTQPGHRLPHAWLRSDAGRVSTLDLVRPSAFLLLAGAGAGPWRQAAAAVAARLGLAIDVVSVGEDLVDSGGTWATVREVGEEGAILVRPDQHVAWRSFGPAEDAADLLLEVLGKLLGKAPLPAG